ncbi:MAG: outer membrane protein [Gemmatimonadaceae bacterium]
MKQFLASLLLFLCLALGLPSLASGQKMYAVAIGGGAAIPVGKLSDTQETGYNAIVAIAIGVADLPFGLRLDGIYNDLGRNTSSVPSGSGGANSNLRVIGGLANLVYAFPGTTAKPYLLAGAGIYNVKAKDAGTKARKDFGFNAGLGATFGFGPLAMFLESRYHSVSRDTANGGVFQFVPVTVGLMF